MARQAAGEARGRGTIERRGNSLRVRVYAGLDPLTGKRLYLTESTADEAEAQRILTRLRNQVDEQRHARTNATLLVAINEWLKVHEIDDSTRRGYEIYIRLHIGRRGRDDRPAIGELPVGKVTARVLEQFYAELRRCRIRCDDRPRIEHRIDGPHECRTIRHKRPPGRPPAAGYPPHDCATVGCKIIECKPHTCAPLSNSTILKIHGVISGTLDAAVRWDWIKSNPAEKARKPRQPVPEPDPPTVEQTAQIVEAAWAEDVNWGTLVWLVMVTGLRRGELLGLRWTRIDLEAGTLKVRRNWVDGKEKDTKTHQMRRISLDPATVEILTEHRSRYENDMQQLGVKPNDDAFLFSYRPLRDRPCDPSGITHRYERLCKRLGIDSKLHALRHYSATELLTAGVDLRTVAGRLGHAGGGATTLRVYAAWVGESDRRAAEILGGKLQRPRPATPEPEPPDTMFQPPAPAETITVQRRKR